MSIELVMPSNHFILCRPLFLPPSIFPSIGVFSNESALHIKWPKYWSFSFNISPSNEYTGLISFRMDWLDLLAVQGTLKSLLQPQFKCINSSVLSFLYGPTLTFIRRLFSSSSLSAIRVVSSAYLRLLIFLLAILALHMYIFERLYLVRDYQ